MSFSATFNRVLNLTEFAYEKMADISIDDSLNDMEKLMRRQLVIGQVSDVSQMLSTVGAFCEDYIWFSVNHIFPAIKALRTILFLDGKLDAEIAVARKEFDKQIARAEATVAAVSY